jgi:hypothetical protein
MLIPAFRCFSFITVEVTHVVIFWHSYNGKLKTEIGSQLILENGKLRVFVH